MIEKSKILKSPHGFSTRLGGVSTGIYESMNLSGTRGDDPALVRENWARFLSGCGIEGPLVVSGKQIHSARIHIAGKEDLEDPSDLLSRIEADGYVTNEAGLPLAVYTADCVPVLLEDSTGGVIGAVHSGWRGTVLDINRNAVEKMEELGAVRKMIHIAIGPAIDRCCFEVGNEVIEGIEALLGPEAEAFYSARGDKYMLNLRGVVRERYRKLGIPEENIELVGGCTMCRPDLYWSHRATRGVRGSMAAVIMKNP